MDYIYALHNQGKRASAHFGRLLFLGILNIILGVAAMIFTGLSTLVSMLYLGWFLIFSGAATAYFAVHLKKIGGHWSPFIFGILAVVCGILILFRPMGDAVVLTLLITVYLFTIGLVSLTSCLLGKFQHKGLVIFNGLVSIFCAYIIYAGWPFSGTWVPGAFLGLYLIFHGVTQVKIGLSGKKYFKKAGR